MMKTGMKLVLLGTMLALSASGCAHRKNAKAFEKAYETAKGVNLELVKLSTETSGYAVFQNKSTGEYIAVNVDKFDRKKGMTLEQFAAAAGANAIISNLAQKSETRSELVSHDEWISTGGYWDRDPNTGDETWVDTGYWSTYYTTEYYTYIWYEGNGFRFETNASASKDLESIAASVSDTSKQTLADGISARYGLSEDRSLELANLAVAWNKLEGSREMTDADKAVFSKEALGANVADFEKAMAKKAKGDATDYQSLLKKAADTNGVSPEHAEKILNELFVDES